MKKNLTGRLMSVGYFLLLFLLLGGCVPSQYTNIYTYKSRMIETVLVEKWDCGEAVGSLAKNLKAPNWNVRKDAAELLGEIHTRGCSAFSTLPSLRAAMKDRDENVRLAAAWSMGIICADSKFDGIQDVVKSLIEGLRDEFWLVRVSSADALGQIGREANSAIKGLVDAGSDPEWWVRMSSVMARKRIEESVTSKRSPKSYSDQRNSLQSGTGN